MKTLAVIPARAGSKSIPNKNIVDINGKPLIAWTIIQALRSGVVDYVHVSTDSPEIADIAQEYGASCEFLRPVDIAGDTVGTRPTMLHSINELAARGYKFDFVLELQPTYCFRGSQCIAECFDTLKSYSSHGATSLLTCFKIEDTSHPDYCLQTTVNSNFLSFGKEPLDSFARQQLRPVYACKGLVLVSSIDAYLDYKSFFAGRSIPFIVNNPIQATDINTMHDLDVARAIATMHPQTLL